MSEISTDASHDDRYLRPAPFIDSDNLAVAGFAATIAGSENDNRAIAVKLYYAVRDRIRYDPYVPYAEPDTYRASAVLAKGSGYCVGKAALLAAAARARGIPARVAFADVRNHLATPRLLRLIGTDIFLYHGITELWLNERWVKATPTFNLTLCEKFHLRPLDFDGVEDAILHPFDRGGRQHMEYLRQRGNYPDVPVDIIMPMMLETYPALARRGGAAGDFAQEAEELG
jgi:transglutaminase-like putative cysteine protease